MEELGWIATSTDAERLLSQWLYADLWVDVAADTTPWPYGALVTVCGLSAQVPCIANLRARTADCPG